jgi:lipopolysaccharide/colanic/teichoic acid biosynthesis glycosyltransferase
MYITVKQLFDIIFTIIILPFLIPLIIAISVLIKISSPSENIFFIQERVGYKSQKFKVFKFRTMDSKSKSDIFTSEDDLRITPIGRLLRKYRIDEIPQFFNILLGKMSLIGPRPEQVHYVEKLRKMYSNFDDRHSVYPGITGLAQIEYGYVGSLIDYKNKLDYDLLYVKNLNLFTDIKIFFQTFKVIFFGNGSR